MSIIDDLLSRIAPNGVTHRALGEIGTVVRGKRFVKDDMVSSGVPCVHYGEIYTKYGVSAAESFSFVTEERAEALRFAQPGDVILASAGETIEDIGKSFAWLGDGPIAIHDACYAVSTDLDPRYLSYFFSSPSFRDQLRSKISSSKISSISTKAVAGARVPVPPRDVQREIVRVLDAVTQLKADLEADLLAELEARRRQYMYYRSELLSFDLNADWVPFSDVVEYTNGKAHEKLSDPDGCVAMVTARFISRNGEANRFLRLADVLTPAVVGDVALVLSDLPNGRALARTFYVDQSDSFAINQRVARLRVKDPTVTNPRFVYHYLDRNPGLLRHDNGVDQTHLSKAQVTGLPFPVLSTEEQDRIVSVLDRFYTLCNDISIELHLELAARRKQYDYYLDKLLTFEDVTA